jgi:hypothetical protein
MSRIKNNAVSQEMQAYVDGAVDEMAAGRQGAVRFDLILRHAQQRVVRPDQAVITEDQAKLPVI